MNPTDDTKLLVVVSDLHCGSSVALSPPELLGADGRVTHNSTLQEWIHGCWLHFWRTFVPDVAQGRPFALLINGDLIDGLHHKSKQHVSDLLSVHMAAAVDVLREPVSMASRVFITRGTEAHVGHDTEDAIGKMLGSVRDPDTGYHAAHHWNLEINGTRVSARHHMPATKRPWLEASALSLELCGELLNTARATDRPPDVIIRSHRHVYGLYDGPGGMAICTPSWQGPTNFVHKAVTGAVCQMGGVVLDFDNRRPGELPTVHRKLYTPKASTAVRISA